MASKRSGVSPHFGFLRYGVCLYTVDGGHLEERNSGIRRRSLESAKASLDRTFQSLLEAMQPRRKLPRPELRVRSVTVDGGGLREALKKAQMQITDGRHLVRVIVHPGLPEDLGPVDLEQLGMSLLISLNDDGQTRVNGGWGTSSLGIPTLTTSGDLLEAAVHDVMIDLWMGNHLTEPGLSDVRALLSRGELFARKVEFARRILNAAPTFLGPILPEAGYVSFGSLARRSADELDIANYVRTWADFVDSCSAEVRPAPSGAVGSGTGAVPPKNDFERDALLVQQRTKRPIKLKSLAVKLAKYPGQEVVVLVALRPGKTDRERTLLASLGLRGVNSAAVMRSASEEWHALGGTAEDLRLTGRIAIVPFTAR